MARKYYDDYYKMAADGKPVIGFTCCDTMMASCMEASGADIIICDDSLNKLHLGNQTISFRIYMEEMMALATAVRRGCRQTTVVCDIPFPYFQISDEDAIKNASRIIQECAVESVMIEGAAEGILHRIRAVTGVGIAVMGHLGIQPQSLFMSGGLRPHGGTPDEADQLLKQAEALEKAGVWAIMLEGVPAEVCSRIRKNSSVLIFSMNSGPDADGFITEYADILGYPDKYHTGFSKPYLDIKKLLTGAFSECVSDIKSGKFFTDTM